MDQAPEETAVPQSPNAPVLSAGSALKAIRETRGLSLQDVSARIKYSASQIAHLEAQNWEQLPEGVPLRGLVRNYAKFLEADTENILQLLENEVGASAGFSSAVATNLDARRPIQQTDISHRGEPVHRTWAWLLIILILLATVGVYAINRGWVPEDWLIFEWMKALRE